MSSVGGLQLISRTYAGDTQSRILYKNKSTCTRNVTVCHAFLYKFFFAYKNLAWNGTQLCSQRKKLAGTWSKLRGVIGRLFCRLLTICWFVVCVVCRCFFIICKFFVQETCIKSWCKFLVQDSWLSVTSIRRCESLRRFYLWGKHVWMANNWVNFRLRRTIANENRRSFWFTL